MDSFALTPPLLLMIALSICMLWVVVSDASRYIISNRLNAVLLALYVVAVIVLPIPGWLPAIGAAAIILAVGLGLFALGLMGGGDIKLLVVLSLWTGWSIATPQFIFLTGIAGGVLVFAVLLARAVLPPILRRNNPERALPRLLTKKQPVPYGIAIAMAFGWMLWTGMVAELEIGGA
jgi:prepilin peptidase CpaA